MEMAQDLLVEHDGLITWLTLNRPERLNALTATMLDALRAALEAERRSPSRVIVIRGAGRAFSAGHDLSQDAAEVVEPGDSVADLDRQASYLDLFFAIWDHPKPVVAAVHGYCMAGATQLVTFCDFTIVAEDAVITASPVLPLGGGFISPLLAYKVGVNRAKLLSFVPGYRMSGTQAADWGWASAAVPPAELDSYVRDLVGAVAKTPASILRMKKIAINRVLELAGFRSAAYMGAETDVVVHGTDAVEALKTDIHDRGLKAAIAGFGRAQP
ncbi:MAG: crotonase/enoyl-CoA hydratase family protein [Mycobacteriales bacterium]